MPVEEPTFVMVNDPETTAAENLRLQSRVQELMRELTQIRRSRPGRGPSTGTAPEVPAAGAQEAGAASEAPATTPTETTVVEDSAATAADDL